MPKIMYIEKNFRADKLALIKRVNSVVAEYAEQGYSLTLRQVYYQMVARDIIENNLRSYKNLGELISNARLAGLVDWNAIEDRTRNLRERNKWDDPQQIISAIASQYHVDYWAEQEYYVEVWVEKDALVGIVGQICDKLDVPYFSCRGYTSQSELWGAARRLKSRSDRWCQHTVLLHLGDHDPSGIDMSRDIVERLKMFGATNVDFQRLALNMGQVDAYEPPPNPTKLTDSRASGYIRAYGHSCWELDALEPSVISELISENVTAYRDEDAYQEAKRREDHDKEQLIKLRDAYERLEDRWDDVSALLGI